MLMSWPYSFIWQTTCELHSYGCWKYDIESFFLSKSFLWLVIFTHDIADFVCIFYIYNKSVILLIYLIKWNVKLFQFIIVKVFCLLRKWLFGLWKVTKISVPKCPLPIWKLIQIIVTLVTMWIIVLCLILTILTIIFLLVTPSL